MQEKNSLSDNFYSGLDPKNHKGTKDTKRTISYSNRHSPTPDAELVEIKVTTFNQDLTYPLTVLFDTDGTDYTN